MCDGVEALFRGKGKGKRHGEARLILRSMDLVGKGGMVGSSLFIFGKRESVSVGDVGRMEDIKVSPYLLRHVRTCHQRWRCFFQQRHSWLGTDVDTEPGTGTARVVVDWNVKSRIIFRRLGHLRVGQLFDLESNTTQTVKCGLDDVRFVPAIEEVRADFGRNRRTQCRKLLGRKNLTVPCILRLEQAPKRNVPKVFVIVVVVGRTRNGGNYVHSDELHSATPFCLEEKRQTGCGSVGGIYSRTERRDGG